MLELTTPEDILFLYSERQTIINKEAKSIKIYKKSENIKVNYVTFFLTGYNNYDLQDFDKNTDSLRNIGFRNIYPQHENSEININEIDNNLLAGFFLTLY